MVIDMTIWKRIVAAATVLALGAYSLGITGKAEASNPVPDHFRVYDNYANVKKLVDYNDAGDPNNPNKIQPWGIVKFSDGNYVPEGYRLWFLDQGDEPIDPPWDPCTPFYPDHQVIGVVNIEPGGGIYFFNPPAGPDIYMYGDRPTNNVDEGAQVGFKNDTKGEEITIIAQDPNNKFFESSFVEGSFLLIWGYAPIIDNGDKQNDITVYDANELPNLSYDMNDLDRFTWWWLADDCNDVEYWSGIDPNLCYCEEFDADWDGDMDFVDFAYFRQHWEPNE